MASDFDAGPLGRPCTYHRLDKLGARVELVDQSAQPDFLKTWAPGTPPMPALDLTAPEDTAELMPVGAGDDAGASQAVVVEFLAAIDHGHATRALNLFTDDDAMIARGDRLEGREAIGRFLAQRESETDRRTAHVIANDTASTTDDGLLELRATLLLYVPRDQGGFDLERIVETSQTFRHGETGWRICRRDVWPLHPAA